MGRFKALYGASPLHLIAVIASFAVAGWAFFKIAQTPTAFGTFVWFAAAVFAHDLIAFPLYSTLNLIAHRTLVGPSDEWLLNRRVPALNYLRIPAILSGLAFVLFFPLILSLASEPYTKDTGLSVGVFLGRYLALVGALFLISGLLYAVQLRRAGRGEAGLQSSSG